MQVRLIVYEKVEEHLQQKLLSQTVDGSLPDLWPLARVPSPQ